jgi:tetratricopeptide (TPR) repeat protein
MRLRFSGLTLVFLLALAWWDHAAAQAPNWVEPPPGHPPVRRADPSQNIEFLLGALKAAPDETSAKAIENRIWSLWLVSPSDTANLLMNRVKTAVDGKDFDLALQLLDALVKIRPDFVEAWNRRATIHFIRKDYGRSLADIAQVLAREPRHFGALAGLGFIMQEFGDSKRALDAFRRALEVHPHLPRIPTLIKSLTDKVDGREI